MNIVRFNYDSIDSTNREAQRFWGRADLRDEALRVMREGRRIAWVFVAREQTAGRGRLGRSWKSPAGGLWVTILWPLAATLNQVHTVGLVAGLAVVEAIEKAHVPLCRIKWPNDILINDRKVCGILCELATRQDLPAAVVIGIGINVNFKATAALLDVSYPATTLLDETGRETKLERLLGDLLEELFRRLLTFESEGVASFLSFVNSRLAWVDSPVTVSHSEEGDLSGVLRGVDEQGRLRLDCGGLELALLTGDVRKMKTGD